MIHTLIKLKFLKLTLLGAFGAGLATLIAKEMRNKKKTEDIDD